MSDAVFRYKRVTAREGKHGPEDFEISISGISPTHGELLALLAGVLKAERRYNGPNQLGPYLLWSFIAEYEPLFAKTWGDIEDLATRADDEKNR
jgi:hypothetical protein